MIKANHLTGQDITCKIIIFVISWGLMGSIYVKESNIPAYQAGSESEWDLRKDADGIKIYTRDYPDSPVKEFMAVTACNSELSEVVRIINDIKEYPNWLRSCKSVTPLKSDAGKSFVSYVEITFPWPLSNRDGIWESTVVTDNDWVYYSEIRSRPELVPEKKGIVRMHNACGFWKIEKLKSGQTRITQQFFADPEGNIPGWVVNLFLVDGPYDTFLNLLELLGEPRR
jgi:hypothetical protein